MTCNKNFPRSHLEPTDQDVLYKLAAEREKEEEEEEEEDPSSKVEDFDAEIAERIDPDQRFKLAAVASSDSELESDCDKLVDATENEPLYKLARPLLRLDDECAEEPWASSTASSRQITTRSQTIGIQTRHRSRNEHPLRNASATPPPPKRKRHLPKKTGSARVKKETDGIKRDWEKWCSRDKDAFFDAVRYFGKDFEKIHRHVVSKQTKNGETKTKTKHQIRFFYYRQWQKLTKLIKLTSFPDTVKKDHQELICLVNYGEMRKKCGGQAVNFVDKKAVKLNELIFTGQTTFRVNGKLTRVKSPVAPALKRMTHDRTEVEPNENPPTPLPPLPPTVTIKLRPRLNQDYAYVHQVCVQNPYIQFSVCPQKPLGALISFLENKWIPAKQKCSISQKPRIRVFSPPNSSFALFELEKTKKNKTDSECSVQLEAPSVSPPANVECESSEPTELKPINVRNKKPKTNRTRKVSEKSDKPYDDADDLTWSLEQSENILIGDLFVMFGMPTLLELQYSFIETALTKKSVDGSKVVFRYKDMDFSLALSRLLNLASIEYLEEKERSKNDSNNKSSCKHCGSTISRSAPTVAPFSSPSSLPGSPSSSGTCRRRAKSTLATEGCPTTPKGRKAQAARLLNAPLVNEKTTSDEASLKTASSVFAVPSSIPLKSRTVPKSKPECEIGSNVLQDAQTAEAIAFKQQLDNLKRSQEAVMATRPVKIRNRNLGNRKPIVVQRMITARSNIPSTSNVVNLQQGNILSVSLLPTTSAERNQDILRDALKAADVSVELESGSSAQQNHFNINKTATNAEAAQPNVSQMLIDVSLPISESLPINTNDSQDFGQNFHAELEILPSTSTKSDTYSKSQESTSKPYATKSDKKPFSLITPTKSARQSEQLISWFGSTEDLTVRDAKLPNFILTDDSNHSQTSKEKTEQSQEITADCSSVNLSFLNENSSDSIMSNSSVDFSLQSLINENSMDYANKFAELASHISESSSQTLETPKKKS